jgi:hypothetical protein
VAAGVGPTVAGVVGDGVVALGVVVATSVVGGAVVVAGEGVTGAVVVAGPAEDDGVGDASGGRDAATVAGGGALLLAAEDADFGGAPAGFAGAVVRAVRSGTGRLGTAGRAGDGLATTREGVELADARGRAELDCVEVGGLFAVLPEVAVAGDDFAAPAVRSWFAAGRSLPAGVIVGAFTAFGGGAASGTRARGGTVTSVTGPGGGTATSVTGRGGTATPVTALGLFAAGLSSGAAACGDTAASR